MLHEFALDPAVLDNWDSFRFFMGNFGISKGRLISEFPNKWKKLVYEACSGCGEIEKKRIEESLAEIRSKLIRSNRIYNGKVGWLINAEQQHLLSPFHAIIAKNNPNRIKHVLFAEEINNDTPHPLWDIKKEECVARKASVLGRYVAPLLKISSEIIFVDPHFNPNLSRFRNTLAEFLNSIVRNNKIRRIEFHLGDKLGRDYFEKECREHIPGMLSRNQVITFIRWREMECGDDLHPRYVFTERGGIRIERGLDEGDDGKTTDVSLLEASLYNRRWKDYQRDTSPFDFVDELKIIGTL
jgi:hypothetical protein